MKSHPLLAENISLFHGCVDTVIKTNTIVGSGGSKLGRLF
jgi:hypothetical protein